MAWTNIQIEAGPGASKAFVVPATSGNLAMVVVTYAGTISSVTDSTASNTYTLASTGTNTTGGQITSIYYSVINTGGTFTITANGSLTMSAIAISENSFTPGTISVVSTNSGQGTGTQAWGAYLNFPVQPAFVVSGVGYDSTAGPFTSNPGYSITLGTSYNSGVNYGNFYIFQENATASPALPGGIFTTATDWSTASAVFASSGDAGTPTYSLPFSQAYSGGNSMRNNAGHY